MYHPFNSIFIRTPRYPFEFLENKMFEEVIQDLDFQESIYIASPVLYKEFQQYLVGKIEETNKKQRIELALYRYISRMSTRCIPFGLFAGVSTCYITGNKTNIVLDDFHRYTRLDMYFLCTLSLLLSGMLGIKENIRYYPNTTLYQIGKKYRYIEYKYIKSERIHQIVSVNRSVYLDTILEMARKGVKIENLLTYLAEKKIENSNALEFIEELIDSQILITELSPPVTGDDFFVKIIHVLEELNIYKTLLSTLKDIQKIFSQLDSSKNTSKNRIKLYQSIIQKIREINIPYEENTLFQIDLTRNAENSTLNENVVDELLSTMKFLNKINQGQRNENLDQFQRAFYNRYEEREVSLLEALDVEIGLGYPINRCGRNIFPLLDGFYIPAYSYQTNNYKSSLISSILLKKVMDAFKKNKKEIILYDDDIKDFNVDSKELPFTISAAFNILKSDSDDLLILLKGFYGSSAAKLITRFAYADNHVNQVVKEIVEKEQELSPNVILAEIAHLPASRVGNVLFRPHIREYEIPYMAHSDLPTNKQIPVSDLFLSVKRGKICLRSKKLNKEIIPQLTNAHNYSKSLIPVYRFLCDLQIQHGEKNILFNWGYLYNELDFLPRVKYKNTILSLATWKVKIEDIKHLVILNDEIRVFNQIRVWREKIALPQKVVFSDYDYELLVDWENFRSVKAFFSIIKNRKIIFLKEFLYDPKNSVVKDKDGNSYVNDCIIPFYKTKE